MAKGHLFFYVDPSFSLWLEPILATSLFDILQQVVSYTLIAIGRQGPVETRLREKRLSEMKSAKARAEKLFLFTRVC
ncbi:hypothetical protein CUU64_12840 [Bacillus sp. V5-8f]|nr:hypothetical protein CUU64_12840 [Bacillus sp. V5-8f]